MLITKTVSSLTKIYPDIVNGERITTATLLQNETFSFQIAFKNETSVDSVLPMYIQVETDLDTKFISEYLEGYVPVANGDFPNSDDYFERKTAGLYPDMLLKRTTNAQVRFVGQTWMPRWTEIGQRYLVESVKGAYKGLWFTINENGADLPTGKHSIRISFFNSANGECVGQEQLDLEVIDAKLPKQTLLYTSWFHCDCLADTYGVEIFSDAFFEIMRSYVGEAAKNGMNMILLPAFTPPLDTSPMMERKTAQLVKVDRVNGEYAFDFSLMKKYIALCRECGIENFEHSHLFTQWGAKSAPKIMAYADGVYTQIFGWETDAMDREYAAFLKSYFRALMPFLKEMGLENKVMFHISDEPDGENIAYYENAQKIISEEIGSYACADAISHYEYYEKGYVKRPIVAVNSPEIDKFIENCDDYWVYHTNAELTDHSASRVISVPSARNRVIGMQMYVGGAKGFLHWGYNYYYGFFSHGFVNPMIDPGVFDQRAGASYVVYPDLAGKPIPSIREKVFYEGLNDYRALQLLESRIGRKAVLDFIRNTVGAVNYKYSPTNAELFDFRQKLNAEIAKHKAADT